MKEAEWKTSRVPIIFQIKRFANIFACGYLSLSSVFVMNKWACRFCVQVALTCAWCISNWLFPLFVAFFVWFFCSEQHSCACATSSFLSMGQILPVVPHSVAQLRGGCHSRGWAQALCVPLQFQACFWSCFCGWNIPSSCWRPQNPAWLFTATQPSSSSLCSCDLVTPKCKSCCDTCPKSCSLWDLSNTSCFFFLVNN